MAPSFTFACELPSSLLSSLFADGSVTRRLAELNAALTLGILDLSAERATVVQQLNAAGIPVTAWLLLPMDQGYWCNASNAPLVAARYAAFCAWTAQYGLVWDGIGIDVEPDIREIQRLLANRWALLPHLLRRIVDDRDRRKAAAKYASLVARMRTDGYRIETYELPFLEDERAVGGSLLHRILGLVDVEADLRLPMLYTSLMGRYGVGLLASYGAGKQAILIGSTGGGVAFGEPGNNRPLDWPAFARDLRLARQLTEHIGIFSLEGCVEQGFLPRLMTMRRSKRHVFRRQPSLVTEL